MKIFINNQDQIFDDGITMNDVMEKYSPNSKGVAAAINNKVAPRADWSRIKLHEGDRIIVISAVCGG